VLNTYQQPPELNSVELTSCGKTDPGVIDALMDRIPPYGLVPFHVLRGRRLHLQPASPLGFTGANSYEPFPQAAVVSGV
jgi:hypothetical protein